MATQRGFRYVEWRATNRSLSTFHWEYAPRAAREGTAAERDQWLDGRADPGSSAHVSQVTSAELYSFWINQDLVVPPAEFRAALARC